MSVRAVVVAHREALAAEGIAAALARYPALVPIGVATGAAETERLATQADVVAIDARIPHAGPAIGRMLKRGLRVVVIGGSPSQEDDDGGIVVARGAPIAQLAKALAPGIRPSAVPTSPLSRREEQVLRLASTGMVGKQIARALNISPKTVEQHKTRAYKRLGVPNQAAAVALLVAGGETAWFEPVQYLTVLRRRWWVIVAAVVVSVATAWLVTPSGKKEAVTSANAPYQATTVMWDPAGPGSFQTTTLSGTISGMDAYAQVVTLPDVVALAAQRLNYQGDPQALADQVKASADQTTGFLDITGYGANPASAEQVSNAFSYALLKYLGNIKVGQAKLQVNEIQAQIDQLKQQGADAATLAPLRAALAQAELDETAPVSLTVIQPARGEPANGQGFNLPKSRSGRALFAALIGLLAGIALALVMEHYDTRMRTRAQTEDSFGLPVLAEIPDISRRWRREVVVATHPTSRPADAFRLLGLAIPRTLQQSDASSNGNGNGNGHQKEPPPEPVRKQPPMTVLVTSPEARDGKTTVAANIAAAYAEIGRNVLVISCDLRRPDINRLFKVPSKPGLAEALGAIATADPEDPFMLRPYVRLPALAAVAIMPSGASSDRYVELLGSDSMDRLLDRAREVADVVVLDCAPLLVASDVVPLLSHADAVVLVARAGKTRSGVAARATEQLTRLGGRIVGVVLNDAKEPGKPLRYRYYRYYKAPKRQNPKSQSRAKRPAEAVPTSPSRETTRKEWETR